MLAHPMRAGKMLLPSHHRAKKIYRRDAAGTCTQITFAIFMTEISGSWLVAVVVCLAAGVIVSLRSGPGAGVASGLALGCLVPTWVLLSINRWPIDVRLTVAAVLVSAYCFHPAGRFIRRITLIDLAVVGLVVWHIVVDWMHEGFNPWIPLRAYGEWALPFVAGWFAVMHRGSISLLAPWFAGVAVVAAVLALPEAIVGINSWELLFGEVDDLVKVHRGQRYGLLNRAMGPTRHPIFLGIVLLMLIPWAVSLIGSEQRRRRQVFGWLSLLTIVLGMFATMSRGPLIGLVVSGVTAACFYSLWARRIFGVAAVAGLFAVVIGWSSFIDFLDRTENTQSFGNVIELNGVVEQYTGTRNRLFVVKVYGPLVLRGGAVGFGTTAVSSFPPNIPGLPVLARTREVLGIVDNSFILIGLRFGLVGLGLLLMLLAATIVKAYVLARQLSLVTYPNGPGFLVALGSILVGVSVVILSVFSSYEFFFWILFTCGVVSGLAALDLRIRRGEIQVD